MKKTLAVILSVAAMSVQAAPTSDAEVCGLVASDAYDIVAMRNKGVPQGTYSNHLASQVGENWRVRNARTTEEEVYSTEGRRIHKTPTKASGTYYQLCMQDMAR